MAAMRIRIQIIRNCFDQIASLEMYEDVNTYLRNGYWTIDCRIKHIEIY